VVDMQVVERLLRNESDVAYKRRVRTMVEYLDPQPGERILDCGCGMGFYLKVLSATAQGAFCGVDGEATVLSFGRRALDGCGVGLTRGDVLRLPYADNAFDKVLFSEVLEHLPDDRAGLAEIRRVLRPGGTLALTVPHRRYPFWYDPINRVAESVFRAPIRTGPFAGIWANHYRLYLPGEVSALLREARFEVEEVRELTHYCFPFTQTIVYTFGKGAIERGLLPGFILRSTHRFQGEENSGSALNPINWALALFNACDRLNVVDRSQKRTYVNIAVRARKGT